jgi:hypothetical protein
MKALACQRQVRKDLGLTQFPNHFMLLSFLPREEVPRNRTAKTDDKTNQVMTTDLLLVI